MVSEALSTDVGYYLQNCRRAKSISLEEVARKTKIRPIVLRQIEGDDLKRIPATFARGFIRAYAEAVGADVQEALQRYEAGCRIHSQMEQDQSLPKQSRKARWRHLLPALAVFACLIAATLYMASRMHPAQSPSEPAHAAVNAKKAPLSKAEPAPPVSQPAQPVTVPETDKVTKADRSEKADGVEPPKQSIPEANETVSGQPPAQPEAPVSTAQPGHPDTGANVAASTGQPVDSVPGAGLVLQLNAVELTWLRVSRDGGPPREMTLRPGQEVTLQAQNQYNLLIGNAGGIRLTLNDQPVRLPDKPGKVVRLKLPQ